MNLSRSEEMMNKEYRHGLVNAQIEVDLPLQIRALRKQLVGSQPDMAKLTGMKQPRISAMEKPGGANFNLETLRRLAEAFDVALIVRFAPFSELLDWSDEFNPDTFRIPSFDEEVQAEREDGGSSATALQALAGVSAAELLQWPVNGPNVNWVLERWTEHATGEIHTQTPVEVSLVDLKKLPRMAFAIHDKTHYPLLPDPTVAMQTYTPSAFAR